MAAILNSAILNLAILDSAITVFPPKLPHTCQDWFPPYAQKNLHSFILTQLDDGSHLEFCHVGLRKLHSFILIHLDDGSYLELCHVGFRHLSFSSQTHSHLPRLVPTICTKMTSLPLPSPPFAQIKLHSFILTQLDDGSHLEFCHVGFSHLSFSSQTDSHLPRLVPTICTKKTFTHSF